MDDQTKSPPILSAAENVESTRFAVLRITRLSFLALFVVVVTLSALYFQPDKAVPKEWPRIAMVILAIAFVIASLVGAVDLLTRKKKIGAVIAVFFGVVAAMLATVALGSVVDLLGSLYEIDPKINNATKVLLGIALAYLAVTTILQTQDDFRLVIPYVEFAKQIRGTKPLILDSSALIDARIVDIASTGLIQSPVIVPRFVILELQRLADSSDRLSRAKGRRGLDMVTRLQRLGTIAVSIDELPVPGKGVDQMLIEFARLSPGLIVTTDLGLARVAEIQKIGVINIHELANALKPALVPGEQIAVVLVREGEQQGQGVGYLDDGTMVVAEGGAHLLGQRVDLTVASNLQTAAGRLIFAKIAPGREPEAPKPAPTAASASNGTHTDTIENAEAGGPPAEAPPEEATVSTSKPAEPPRPRSPFPPNPPRSVREGTSRNPRR